jgi:hypothetical protein
MKREYIILLYNLIVWFVFGIIYSFGIENQSEYSTEAVNRNKFSAFYFSATIHSTLGSGDINPSSTLTKIFVMLHLLLVLAGNFGIYLLIKV